MSDERTAPGRLVGQGREAEIFEWGDNQVLRLLRDPAAADRLPLEVAAMAAAAAQDFPVPTLGGIVTVDGRPGLAMQRIDGPDLITKMGRRPWSLFQSARMLGTLHARLHEIEAPASLAPLRARVRERIEVTEVLPDRLAAFALAQLDQLPDGTALCHGDFHPGNVLVGREGPVVIDWVNAARGDPTADFARSRVMVRIGELPPGSSRVMQVLQHGFRGIFESRYAHAYLGHRPVDPELLARWEVVRAADRLSEGIEAEYPTLLGMLEHASG